MTKLYDVHDKFNRFSFRASLPTVGRLMNWRKEALDRIEHETKDGGACKMFNVAGLNKSELIAYVIKAEGALPGDLVDGE